MDLDRLSNVLQEDQRLAVDERDRRTEERVPFRTLLTILPSEHSSAPAKARSLQAWSVDVSPHGAGIVTKDEIPSKTIFIRFLLPWAGDRTIQCEVVRHSRLDDFLGEEGPFNRYGVQFKRLLTDAEFATLLGDSPDGC